MDPVNSPSKLFSTLEMLAASTVKNVVSPKKTTPSKKSTPSSSSSKKSTPKNQPVNPMNQTDARSAPPIYKQYDKAIQYPTNSSGNKPTNSHPTSTTRPFNNTSSPSQAGNSFTSQNIMQLTKEKNLAIISSLKDSTAALTKKQEEKRKVDAIMASIQGPQFNVDFFNKVGSLYNRFSGWCSE